MEKKIKARTKKRLVYIGLFFIASIVLDFFIEMHAPDKNKIGTETLVMLYTLVMVIFYVCLDFIVEKEDAQGYKEKLEEYEIKVEKLENEIKDESRVIWQKYHELNTYRIGELLKNNLELFVKKESSIFSAQVYEYNEIITADSVQIKVKFLMGYVEEQENLNSILQNYYLLPKKEYIEYKNLIEISDLDNIYMYLEKIVTKLKEVTLENSNIKYSYIWLLGDLLLEKLNVLNKISLVDDECVKEKLTANLRREGILKGILLNEPYWFNGKQDGDKKDRKYITSPFTFNDKSVIILFTGHKDIIVDEQYLVGLLKRFNEMFKK